MSRLIDADALIEAFDENDLFLPEVVKKLIENQPTAYDVDKVVAELDAYITKIVGRKSKMYQRIIDIVKRGVGGGVN